MFKHFMLVIATYCLASSAMAETGSVQLRAFLDGLETFQASFQQTMINIDEGETASMTGVMKVKRPGRFRWDYSAPNVQHIISDGDTIWLHDVELEQITYIPQSQALSGTPAQLLLNDTPLETSFDVADIGERNGLQLVELLPKAQDGEFRRIIAGFENDQIRVMEMFDQYGQVTRMNFLDNQKNIPLDDSLFVFEAPLGIDIFGN